MEAESCLDGSNGGGAMGTRRVPWEERGNRESNEVPRAIPPQKQVLHKGLELTASIGERSVVASLAP